MPLTDAQIQAALEAERNIRETVNAQARTRIPLLEAEAAKQKKAYETELKRVESLRALGTVTKADEESLTKLAQAYDGVNYQILTFVNNIKTHNEQLGIAKERSDQIRERFGRLTNILDTITSSFEGLVRQYNELKLSTDNALAGIGTFSRSMRRADEELLTLRNSLRLTREQSVEFLQTWTRSQDLGISTDRIREMGLRLRELRGHAEGMKRLRDLVELPATDEQLRQAAKGSIPDQVALLQGAQSRAQREALRDIMPGAQPSRGAGAINFRQELTLLGDRISEAFGEVGEKFGTYIAPLLSQTTMVAGQTILIVGEIGTANTLLARIAMQNPMPGGGVLPPSIGGRAAALGGGAVRNFLASKGMLAGAAGVGGFALGAAGSYVASQYAEGTTGHGVGVGLRGVGGVIGAAGTGAAVGSLLGPVGTVVGGIVGGLYGLWQSSNDLSESWNTLTTSSAKLAERQANQAASILNLTQEFQNMGDRFQRISQQSREGRTQERGRFAESLMGTVAAGGGDLRDLITQRAAGTGAAQQEMERNFYAQERQRLKSARGVAGRNPNQQERLEQIRQIERQEAALGKMQAEAVRAFSVEADFSALRQAFEAQIATYRNIAQLATQRLDVLGSVSGTFDNINKFEATNLAASEKEIQILQERYQDTQAALNLQNDNLRAVMARGDLTPDELTAYQAQLAANNQLLAIERTNIAVAQETARLAKVQVLIRAGEAAGRRTLESEAFGTGEARATTAGARGRFGLATGGSLADFGKEAEIRSNLAAQLAASEAEEIKAIQARINTAKESLRPEDALRVTRELNIQVENRRRATLEAQTSALEANIRAGTADIQRQRGMNQTQTEILQTQQSLAEYLGASYSQIFTIQGRILDRQIQAAELTRAEMDRVAQIIANTPGDAKATAEYQRLQVQYAQQSAEVVRSSLGRQRDFLDRALGRAFGVSQGTKIQPLINDRMIFGEFTRGPNDFNVGGRPMTIGERERLLNEKGARRALAPLPGAPAGPPGNPFGPGAGAPAAVPPGAPGGPPGVVPAIPGFLNQPIDISGNITVDVGLKTDLLEATIRRVFISMQRRGNP
jgi:hypothetical protein